MKNFEMIRQSNLISLESSLDGYWIHKDTKVKTEFGMSATNISGTTFNAPSYLTNAIEIKIPEGVTALGTNALYNASNLESLLLPATLTSIGNNALNNTLKLYNLVVKSPTPPSVGALAYVGDFARFQIKVQASAFDTFRNHSFWSNFSKNLYVINDLIPGSRVHSGYTQQNKTKVVKQNNIIIENLIFNNPQIGDDPGNALVVWGSENVIIRNCKFTNMKTIRGIAILECSNVCIYNCDFDNIMQGVKVINCNNSIKIFSNDFRNMLGKSQGGSEWGQAIQIQESNGVGVWSIQDNAIENIQGQSYVDDAINVFYSSFSSDTPLRIRNNWIRGGGPSDSGGGIILGDNGNGFTGGNQIMEDNILVNPGQYGIAIAGGSYQTLQRNIVFGAQFAWSNVGVVGVNWDPGSTSTNITIRENRVNWTNNNGVKNPVWIYENVEPVAGKETNIWNDTSITPNVLPTQIIGI